MEMAPDTGGWGPGSRLVFPRKVDSRVGFVPVPNTLTILLLFPVFPKDTAVVGTVPDIQVFIV
jgi:hypothetical protein